MGNRKMIDVKVDMYVNKTEIDGIDMIMDIKTTG